MPLFQGEIEQITGLSDDSEDSEQRREAIKSALNCDEYRPDSVPDTVSSALYNPAIDAYQDAGLTWGDNGWEPVDNTEPLELYPEYVPTDQALTVLRELQLVEVGAGNGYWTYLINEHDGDCVATDECPPAANFHSYPGTVTVPKNMDDPDDDETFQIRMWEPVTACSAQEAVEMHPSRDVLMVHPSGATKWAASLLDEITDRTFVFVGEWYPGADATPMFFKKLVDEWELVNSFPVYDWASMHVQGHVFTHD